MRSQDVIALVVNALAPDKTPVVAHNSGAALCMHEVPPRVWWLGMLAVSNFGLVRLRGLNFTSIYID